MPVRLEFFLQFSFSNIVFMFLLNYTCSVLCSRNSRKAFKFLSKRMDLLLYGNQYRNLCFVHKTAYLWPTRSPRGVELSLSACPGVGNTPPSENKIANPRGYARGSMVKGRIEPCITTTTFTLTFQNGSLVLVSPSSQNRLKKCQKKN